MPRGVVLFYGATAPRREERMRRFRAENPDGMEPIERVLPKLKRLRQNAEGNSWSAQCPAHEDKHPSLTVAVGRDGRVLLNCHKGCTYGEIMAALGLHESKGFADEPPTPLPSEGRHKIATYDYHDAEGNVLFQTVRYHPKDFRQRHSNGNGEWVWNLNGVTRVLYRLPELLAADPGYPVFVVEGEKDAETLASYGFIATTNPMGAGKWRPEYAESLHGRHVVLLPDNDEAGYKHAAMVAESLRGVAASVRWLALPGLPIKGDVSDWLDAGHTITELEDLARGAPENPPEETPHEPHRYTVHSAKEAFQPIPPIEWVIDNLLARQSVGVMVGAPGSKKTYTALDMAVCVALGKPWLGRMAEQGTVLLIDEESGNRRLLRRLHEVLRAHGADQAAPIKWISLEMVNLLKAEELEQLDRLFAEIKPALVIVDALADVMPGGDENSVQDTHPVLMALRQLADRWHCCILAIHHSNKTGSYRGSTAILGAIDLMLMVESPKESNEIKYSTEKTRDTEPQTFAALITFKEENVRLTTAMVIPQTQRRARSDQYVIDYLNEHGGRATMQEIQLHADRCSAEGAKHAVYRLVEEGVIRRCDGGKAGEKATYEIVDGK